MIWTSDTWSARLALLWLCGALAGEPAEAGATVYLVDVRRPRRPSERGRYGSSYELGEYNADQLRQAFSAATRLGRPTIRAGAALWRKYADPDPTAFDRSRRAGFPGIRLLNSVSDCYGVLFPRRVRGRIDLSILDAALLSYFLEKGPRKWHSLAAISGWMFTRGRYISEALGSERCIGDRLAMWASRSPVIDSGGATTSGPGRDPIYRLTDTGRLAAREARGWVPIAPAVFVGGCKAYDPDRLWVRSGTRRRWRVERGG